jgi:hypothetical protein
MLGWFLRLGKGGRAKAYQPPVINYLDPKALNKFVYDWNNSFPIDRWWREKHQIPFNSKSHREVSLLDMRFEFEEDNLYTKIRNEPTYELNMGDFMKVVIESDLPREEQLKRFLEEEKDFNYSEYDEN